MAKTLLEEFVSSPARMRRFQQERAISAVTGLICETMKKEGTGRAELAEKLGKTKGWVTQLLDGEANKTIRTVADVLAVLGQELRVSSQPIQIGPQKPVTLKIFAGSWTKPQSWQAEPLQVSVKSEKAAC